MIHLNLETDNKSELKIPYCKQPGLDMRVSDDIYTVECEFCLTTYKENQDRILKEANAIIKANEKLIGKVGSDQERVLKRLLAMQALVVHFSSGKGYNESRQYKHETKCKLYFNEYESQLTPRIEETTCEKCILANITQWIDWISNRRKELEDNETKYNNYVEARRLQYEKIRTKQREKTEQ